MELYIRKVTNKACVHPVYSRKAAATQEGPTACSWALTKWSRSFPLLWGCRMLSLVTPYSEYFMCVHAHCPVTIVCHWVSSALVHFPMHIFHLGPLLSVSCGYVEGSKLPMGGFSEKSFWEGTYANGFTSWVSRFCFGEFHTVFFSIPHMWKHFSEVTFAQTTFKTIKVTYKKKLCWLLKQTKKYGARFLLKMVKVSLCYLWGQNLSIKLHEWWITFFCVKAEKLK